MLNVTYTIFGGELNMPRQGFQKVGIPSDLYKDIAKHIRKNPQLGYLSVSEFVRAAFRDVILSKKYRK